MSLVLKTIINKHNWTNCPRVPCSQVCGPRWMQVTRDDHFGNGMCYWMEAGAPDHNAIKMLPLIDQGKQEKGVIVRVYGV